MQWRLLEHLASEILADGTGERSFFCVGDVKQSIYGWREAEPRLLAELDRLLSRAGSARALAGQLALLAHRARVRQPGLRDDRRQRDLRQPRRARARGARLPGRLPPPRRAQAAAPGRRCCWKRARRPTRRTRPRPALELACQRAEEIARAAPHATIGILLRRNHHIARLIYLLRDRHALRASGEGGNPLTDSAAVMHALSLLHLADHPGDRAAAFHVATSPLAAESSAWPPRASPRACFDVAQDLRQRLAELGFGRFCASLLPAVRGGLRRLGREALRAADRPRLRLRSARRPAQ